MAFFKVISPFINKKTGDLISEIGSFFETDEEHGAHLVAALCLEVYQEPAKEKPVEVVVVADKKKK